MFWIELKKVLEVFAISCTNIWPNTTYDSKGTIELLMSSSNVYDDFKDFGVDELTKNIIIWVSWNVVKNSCTSRVTLEIFL